MGRPRVKTIDDSQSLAEVKGQKSKVKTKSDLVKTSNKTERAKAGKATEEVKSSSKEEAKLESVKASGEVETKETEARGDGEKGVPTRSRNERLANEDARRDIEPAGPRAEVKKPQKPGKAKPRSKKYQEITKDLDRTKAYSLPEAVDMVKKLSYSKFNGTLEAHITTAQTGIRGLVSLPFASGRKLRILAFGPSTALRTEDGVTMGDDSIIEEINQGKINFDILVTTPEWMPKLAKVARILGPKGLMPNPKNGTITSGEDGLKKAVEGFQAGKTEYKTESKAPVIHLALGKLNQPNEELVTNIKTLLQTLGKSRVKKVTLSPTMGPGVKVDLASF